MAELESQEPSEEASSQTATLVEIQQEVGKILKLSDLILDLEALKGFDAVKRIEDFRSQIRENLKKLESSSRSEDSAGYAALEEYEKKRDPVLKKVSDLAEALPKFLKTHIDLREALGLERISDTILEDFFLFSSVSNDIEPATQGPYELYLYGQMAESLDRHLDSISGDFFNVFKDNPEGVTQSMSENFARSYEDVPRMIREIITEAPDIYQIKSREHDSINRLFHRARAFQLSDTTSTEISELRELQEQEKKLAEHLGVSLDEIRGALTIKSHGVIPTAAKLIAQCSERLAALDPELRFPPFDKNGDVVTQSRVLRSSAIKAAKIAGISPKDCERGVQIREIDSNIVLPRHYKCPGSSLGLHDRDNDIALLLDREEDLGPLKQMFADSHELRAGMGFDKAIQKGDFQPYGIRSLRGGEAIAALIVIGGPKAFLFKGLQVHHLYQRKGFGQRLLEDFITQRLQEGAQTFEARVRQTNLAGRLFLHSLGFRQEGSAMYLNQTETIHGGNYCHMKLDLDLFS